MRFIRWSIPRLSARDRLIVVLCSMMFTLLGVGIGWVKAKRIVRKKMLETVQIFEKKTGWPMEIGSWTLGPGFITLEDIRLGPESNLLVSHIRAVPGLNPFSDDFGKPTSVSMGSIRFKAQRDLVRELQQKISENSKDVGTVDRESKENSDENSNEVSREDSNLGENAGNKAPGGERRLSPLDSLFRHMPAETVDIKSAGIDILEDDGNTLISVKGLRLRATKSKKKILMRTDSVTYRQYPSESNVEGRIAITNRGHYRFLIRHRAETKKTPPLWVISGEAEKSLGRFQVFTKTRQLPVFMTELITPYLGQDFKFMTSGRIKAARESEGWRFAVRLKSQNVTFVSPVISKEPIGPIIFDLTARGEVSPDRKELSLENATVSLPPRRSRAGESRQPLGFILNGASILTVEKGIKSDPGDSGLALQVALSADLPQTSCQTLLDAAPPGLVPKIEDFRMNGEVKGRLNIVFDSKQPELSEMSPQNFEWHCEVETEPERYAAEKLKQPFMLEKADDSPNETVTRVLSPTNPNFRSLREMSTSVPLAFVASEDASFFAHNGIDSSAIEGAFKRNLTEGRIAVGGSTITMQTAKNLFLTNDRTISRKLQELFFAWHMERVLTKDRILEIYLNIVEFGPGIFGIVHAAKHYFNKEPIGLTLTEAAYLASLLPSPKHRYVSFCRGHLTPGLSNILSGLLRRMLSLGRISIDRFETASNSGLKFNEQARLASAACSNLVQKDQSQN